MKDLSKVHMEKSRRFRRFRRFEVETCARVAQPKKQKNRASLRRRVLGNPLKNLKKKLLSDNFSWKSRQKFWSWNLRTSRTTEEAKKSRQTTSSNSSKSIEELEKPVSWTKQNHLFELLILLYFVFQSSQLSQKSFWQFGNLATFHFFMGSWFYSNLAWKGKQTQ